ncbi:hypothetical protein H6P81_016197 [Aristolochia fimbriata]|uniref:Aminotransferase-like plant mobile domain-containing protein n=1 Tax=Aristolochia fimbriata TaxID=158543 RepID=A0AAV7EAU8_ARIFI|nr:hypothetical protein H6P81_016197 [Aristolochia fimbriata]
MATSAKAGTVVQSRCVPHKIKDMFNSVNVAQHYMEAFDRTPFGHLRHVKDITMERPLLHFIVSNWDCTECGVKVNGRILPFRPIDVALVLGIKNHGTPVDIYHNSGPTQEYERLFGRCQVKVSSLVEAFKRLVGSGGEVKDVVRVFILLMFTEVLFPHANGGLKKHFLAQVEDVDVLGSYAWARAVHRFMVDGLNSSVERLETSSFVANYLAGCTLALMVWFKECVSTYTPIQRSVYPRLCRWVRKSFDRKCTVLAKVAGSQPETPAEIQLVQGCKNPTSMPDDFVQDTSEERFIQMEAKHARAMEELEQRLTVKFEEQLLRVEAEYKHAFEEVEQRSLAEVEQMRLQCSAMLDQLNVATSGRSEVKFDGVTQSGDIEGGQEEQWRSQEKFLTGAKNKM